MDIDFVVPMVFEDDPVWQESYMDFDGLAKYYTGREVRYRSWGTERLLVESVRKFMPWVRNIYVILAGESQKREWMSYQAGEPLSAVKVVYHGDIMPKKFLPTFNCCGIEMFLPYIDGLAEHFIYGNDDMYPVSPLKVEDFFVDGKPVQHLEEKVVPKRPNVFHRWCLNQQGMVSKHFGKDTSNVWLHNGHGLAPMLKSACMEALRTFAEEIENEIRPYRTATNHNQYLYVLWQYFTGQYVDGRVATTYLSVSDSLGRIGEVMRNAKGVVCVNDNEDVSDVTKYAELVKEILKEKLA